MKKGIAKGVSYKYQNGVILNSNITYQIKEVCHPKVWKKHKKAVKSLSDEWAEVTQCLLVCGFELPIILKYLLPKVDSIMNEIKLSPYETVEIIMQCMAFELYR